MLCPVLANPMRFMKTLCRLAQRFAESENLRVISEYVGSDTRTSLRATDGLPCTDCKVLATGSTAEECQPDSVEPKSPGCQTPRLCCDVEGRLRTCLTRRSRKSFSSQNIEQSCVIDHAKALFCPTRAKKCTSLGPCGVHLVCVAIGAFSFDPDLR